MAESVYKVIELVGTSNESWEKAAAVAIERASQTLRDLRVAHIVEQDVHIEPGKPLTYRLKMEISFKYEGGDLEELAVLVSEDLKKAKAR
jgi:dodecin